MDSTDFAVTNGKPVKCSSIECSECDLKNYCANKDCSFRRMEWLKSKYNPDIHIPLNTPIDTKILVSDNGRDWFKGYYSGFIDGEHYAFVDGKTSFTSANWEHRTYDYMKLYETSDANS